MKDVPSLIVIWSLQSIKRDDVTAPIITYFLNGTVQIDAGATGAGALDTSASKTHLSQSQAWY